MSKNIGIALLRKKDHPHRIGKWDVLLQMIIRMDRPFANDHLDFLLSTRFFSIFLCFSKFLIFLQKISSSPSKHFLKSKSQGSISRTFLEQCVLVSFFLSFPLMRSQLILAHTDPVSFFFLLSFPSMRYPLILPFFSLFSDFNEVTAHSSYWSSFFFLSFRT